MLKNPPGRLSATSDVCSVDDEGLVELVAAVVVGVGCGDEGSQAADPMSATATTRPAHAHLPCVTPTDTPPLRRIRLTIQEFLQCLDRGAPEYPVNEPSVLVSILQELLQCSSGHGTQVAVDPSVVIREVSEEPLQ